MGSAAMACPRQQSRQTQGRVLGGRYELLRRIGSGASGCVFEAVDMASTNDTHVAVKTIIASDVDDDEAANAEISMHSALNGSSTCPYLTTYFGSFVQQGSYSGYGEDSDESDSESCSSSMGSFGVDPVDCCATIDEVCIVTEFCNGGALADVAQYVRGDHNNAVTEEEMADLCASMVLGLRYMHSRGAMHRDVKSDNVLLTTDGRCKLVDFGISTFLSSNGTASDRRQQQQRSTLCGTPAFMAPEVITASSAGANACEDNADDDDDDDDDNDCYQIAAPGPASRALNNRRRSRSRRSCSLLVNNDDDDSNSNNNNNTHQIGYSGKADVWSVGITAIELAEGVAPAHRANNNNTRRRNPYFMMSSIAHGPAPHLAEAGRENWSPAFHDFLNRCLQKDPQNRASTDELIAHPFVAVACANLLANDGRSERIAALVGRVGEWKRCQAAAAAERRVVRRLRRRLSPSSSLSSSGSDSTWDLPVSMDGSNSGLQLPAGADSGTFVVVKPPQAAEQENCGTVVVVRKQLEASPRPALRARPLQLLQSLHLRPLHNTNNVV